jgi:hypothetical protein
MKDPIVDEVHRGRENRSTRFKHDLDAMFADLRRSEKESRSRGARFVCPRRRNNSGPWPIVRPDEQSPEDVVGDVDPIVAEVRAAREAHAAKFNYDLDAIVADFVRQQEEHKDRIVSLTPRRSRAGIQPATKQGENSRMAHPEQ